MGGHFFDGKGVLQTEARLPGCKRGIYFGYNEDEIDGVTVEEIPAISMELVLHLCDEVRRSIKVERLLPPYEHPQQPVKTYEMIDVRVRDEDML